MPSLLTAHDIVKWLAELSGGEAIGVLVGGMAGTVWLIVKGALIGFRKKTKEEIAKADVPVAPMPTPVALPPVPPDVTGRVAVLELEVKMARAEWDLDTCRSRVRELEATVRDLGSDGARTAQALSGERIARERAESRLAEAVRERDAADARASAMAEELADLKRSLGSSSTSIGTVTPLRPPPKGKR